MTAAATATIATTTAAAARTAGTASEAHGQTAAAAIAAIRSAQCTVFALHCSVRLRLHSIKGLGKCLGNDSAFNGPHTPLLPGAQCILATSRSDLYSHRFSIFVCDIEINPM